MECWLHHARVMSQWIRYVIAVFAAAIGFFAGLMGAGGIAGGFAWIFLFGDEPWPSWSDTVILAAAIIGGAVVATLFAVSAWRATAPK
jgi:hypothetical protein